jgi:hypothetical protein
VLSDTIVVDQPPAPPMDLPPLSPRTPAPKPSVDRVSVLADGRYDAYLRTVLQQHPTWTNNQVKALLTGTTTKVGPQTDTASARAPY